MPSERSKPSEITGENAARSNVRSISLATCCSPFWTTTSVTSSNGNAMPLSSHHADVVAGIDHGGRVELLDDGGPGELGADGQLFAAVDRRLDPAALEPHAAG